MWAPPTLLSSWICLFRYSLVVRERKILCYNAATYNRKSRVNFQWPIDHDCMEKHLFWLNSSASCFHVYGIDCMQNYYLSRASLSVRPLLKQTLEFLFVSEYSIVDVLRLEHPLPPVEAFLVCLNRWPREEKEYMWNIADSTLPVLSLQLFIIFYCIWGLILHLLYFSVKNSLCFNFTCSFENGPFGRRRILTI